MTHCPVQAVEGLLLLVPEVSSSSMTQPEILFVAALDYAPLRGRRGLHL